MFEFYELVDAYIEATVAYNVYVYSATGEPRDSRAWTHSITCGPNGYVETCDPSLVALVRQDVEEWLKGIDWSHETTWDMSAAALHAGGHEDIGEGFEPLLGAPCGEILGMINADETDVEWMIC